VGCVSWSQEGALVMIEPPSDLGRTGILEIHNGIFIAIEMLFIKKCAGAV